MVGSQRSLAVSSPMRTVCYAFIAALALGGCPRPAADPALDPGPARGTHGAEAPAREPSEAWLREVLTAGRLPELVAPDGVIWVEHYREVDDAHRDPRADAEGIVREARRRCGDELREAAVRLERQLQQKLEALGDAAIRCEADRCVLAPMMEFDHEITLEFTVGPGEPMLRAVLRRDPPAHGRDAEEVDAWIAEARREAEAPCAATASTDPR